MTTPETEDGRQYNETRIGSAPLFIQAFSSTSSLCQEVGFKPKCYQDPDDLSHHVLTGYIWAPHVDDANGSWMKVQVDYRINPKAVDDTYEFLTIQVELPDTGFDSRVGKYIDEIEHAWHSLLQHLKVQASPDYDWKMAESVEDTADFDRVFLYKDDDDRSLLLSLDCSWVNGGYISDDYDGLSKDAFVKRISNRMSLLAGSLSQFLGTLDEAVYAQFAYEQAHPKKLQWPVAALRSAGASDIIASWSAAKQPEDEDNPVFNAVGKLHIASEPYRVFVTARRDLITIHLTPEAFDNKNIGKRLSKFALEGHKRKILAILERLNIYGALSIESLTMVKEQTSIRSVGWCVNYSVEDISAMHMKSISEKEMFASVISMAKELHPLIAEFTV